MSWTRAKGFQGDERGVSAVEFALVLPLFLLLFFGGYVLCEEVALSRKVTITTRALTDLVTKYPSMQQGDMNTVLGASTQILAPFNASPLNLRVSEITTDATNGTTATVTWSAVSGSNLTAYKCGCSFSLSSSMLGSPNQSFILGEASYVYDPTPYSPQNLIAKLTMTDHIFMLPRSSNSVSFNSCPAGSVPNSKSPQQC